MLVAVGGCPKTAFAANSPVPRGAKAWRVNPRPGTSFTYKRRATQHKQKENA
jgi:hypothetical protein